MQENDPAPGVAVDGSDLAAKVNELFATKHKRGEAPLSNYAAAKGIEEKTDVPITPQYLSQIRSGKKTNISVVHLRAIATFFGVPASYLIEPGDDERVRAQLEGLRALREAGVRDILTRVAGLSPQALVNMAAVADGLRALEQLPPVDPPADDPSEPGGT
ncbi:Helix-turn-helix protein [Mycobacteroides abscessus subsp. massiliense]|uniref:helix-turn-helix domain-containing protein n=1 Tax=Mycobacteroides abscessus TaxID=36809 RepID=UPI0009A831C6|nr:helix-turn-helix domain-containing protein [Mycobacteroides abscessus]SLE83476.1 Helix-turn-helix protein [Mycobacteroides abscessus subsp. massiliense]